MKSVPKKVIERKNEKPVVYQAANGAVELRVDKKSETVWATQLDFAQLFNVDVRTINDH